MLFCHTYLSLITYPPITFNVLWPGGALSKTKQNKQTNKQLYIYIHQFVLRKWQVKGGLDKFSWNKVDIYTTNELVADHLFALFFKYPLSFCHTYLLPITHPPITFNVIFLQKEVLFQKQNTHTYTYLGIMTTKIWQNLTHYQCQNKFSFGSDFAPTSSNTDFKFFFFLNYSCRQ